MIALGYMLSITKKIVIVIAKKAIAITHCITLKITELLGGQNYQQQKTRLLFVTHCTLLHQFPFLLSRGVLDAGIS